MTIIEYCIQLTNYSEFTKAKTKKELPPSEYEPIEITLLHLNIMEIYFFNWKVTSKPL